MLTELRSWLSVSAAKLRTARQFQPLARVTVAQDIAADCATAAVSASALAYKAETYDREATRLIAAAQTPDSPGGPAITAGEMLPIANLIARSAELDHELAEIAECRMPIAE